MVMPVLPISFLLAVFPAQTAPVTLNHQFKAGEKSAYQVLSHITSEQRGAGLSTWLPSDLDINYNFSYTVNKVDGDGIALIRYLRPTMTEISGETADSEPTPHVQKVNFDAMVTVSPINEILTQKDLSKKNGASITHPLNYSAPQGAMGFFIPFISDIHRLALFIGNVQDGLDFAPKLPLNAIKVGDSWKKTVGFEPQALKGSSGKQAVQRLDYTYTYKGPMTVNGKNILRVEGRLKYNSDAAAFFKQLLGDRASETNVVKVPITFDSTVEFDLDPVTKDLLHGDGTTTGGFQVFIQEVGDTAAQEEKFKGRTTIDLVGKKMTSSASR